MLITTSKENLNAAIGIVQRAINPKSIIPLYSCIKLEVRGNLAIFTGTGLDTIIECSIPVQTEREGVALIPARYFGDIVRRLPDIPVTLEHSETMEMTIRYEKSVFTLRTMTSDDFPSMEPFRGGLTFSVGADTFKKLVRQSSFAASTDEMKAVFTGLLWEINGEEVSVVGTDTHRLSWAKGTIHRKDVENKDDKEDKEAATSFIIPARIASEIARLIQSGDCIVQAEKNTVFFSFDQIKISCRVLEGTFPNYRQVIPGKFITTIQVDVRTLRDVAERTALFAVTGETSSTIHLDIAEETLSVYSQSDIGFGREEIAVTQVGDDLKIAFNARYLTDVFKVMEGEKADMQFSGQLSACVMREEGDPDFLYLVLPIKV